jgi:hypothetical protein
LPTLGKLVEKVILKIVQRHIAERGLLNASQFGFRARHSTVIQCMRLTDHLTLYFNNNMLTAAVLRDIEKAFDTTWHLGLLCKLSELKCSISLVKLISYFLSQRKFKVSVEGEMSTPRDIQAEVPQSSILSPTFYSIYMYINDNPQTHGVYVGLFADDICIYSTDHKDGYVLRMLQRDLSAIETWCAHWNIKINEDKTKPSTFLIDLGPLRLNLH